MRGRRNMSGRWSMPSLPGMSVAGLLAAAIIVLIAPAPAFSKNSAGFTQGAASVTEVTKSPQEDGCEQLLDPSKPFSDSEMKQLYDCYVDGSFSDAQGASILSYIDPFWLAMLALLGVGSLSVIFMGFSAPRPAISGKLIDVSEGAIKGAEVALSTLRKGSDCAKLASAPVPVSDSEKQQLEECFIDYILTTSNTRGQFKFSHVKPGWYWLNIKWDLSKSPENPGMGFNWETKGNFLIVFSQEENPVARPSKKHRALAHKVDKFYFSGERDMVINFEYLN